jgi:hypothetical protein
MRIVTLASSFALCLSACATKETVYWEKAKHNKIIVHHVHKTNKGMTDRTEELTAKAADPAWIHTYDLGRMPDGKGGMHEAHRYYVVTQSSHVDLMLPPASKLHPTGPRSVYTPPNYTPMPKDQRINDAVAEAHQAKDKLDDARGKIEQQIAEDNNLRGELQNQMDENARLQEQLNAAMSSKPNSPPPVNGGQSDTAKPGQQTPDALATWGAKLPQ